MLFYSNRKAHPFSISDVPIYKSIFHLLQAPPVTVYKPLFFNVSSTILMTAHILWAFPRFFKLLKLDFRNYILCLTKFYVTIFCIIILDILCILHYFMIFCKHFATTTSFVILKMPLFTIYKNIF